MQPAFFKKNIFLQFIHVYLCSLIFLYDYISIYHSYLIDIWVLPSFSLIGAMLKYILMISPCASFSEVHD